MIYMTDSGWVKEISQNIGGYTTVINVKGEIIVRQKEDVQYIEAEDDIIDLLNEVHAVWVAEQLLTNQMADLQMRKAKLKEKKLELKELELI